MHGQRHIHSALTSLLDLLRQLEMLGVGDREKVSLEFGRVRESSVSLLHREREIVLEGKTSERKDALSLELLASIWNTEDMIISGGAGSLWWDAQFKEVGRVKKNSAGGHAVADCSGCSAVKCTTLKIWFWYLFLSKYYFGICYCPNIVFGIRSPPVLPQ